MKAFSQPFTYDTASMPEGVNTVSGLAVDALGKISPIDAGNAVTVKVDRTPPTVSSLTGTLADKADRAVTNGTYELTANVTDGANRSGVRSITFKREDDTIIESFPITCSGADCPASAAATLSVQINPTTFDAGVRTIKVVAEDSAGNAISDTAATALTFVVDHDPPQITAVDHEPALIGWLGDRALTATATATDDASGVKRFTLTTPNADGSTTSTDTVVPGCDDTIANLCDSPEGRDVSYATATMGDGPARPVSLTATDALGQTSSPPRQWTVDVDTAGPALTLSGAAWDARDTYVGASDLLLQATAVDSVGGQQRSGVASLTLQVDDQPAITRTRQQPCVTTTSEHCDLTESFTLQPAQLSTGVHTVTVTATDQAAPANSTTTSFELHVDKQPPTITDVEHAPSPPQRWRDDVPRSVDVTAHDEHSGVASVVLTLQGMGMPQVQTVDCAGSGTSPCPKDTTASLSYTTSGLPEGLSTASVYARDRADNASEVSQWELKIDRTPPAAAYSGSIHQANGGTLIGGSMDLQVDASDLFSGVREIRFLVDGQERQSKQGVCDEDGCATTLSDTFVMHASSYASGQRTLRVEISDRVGTPEERHVTVREYTVTNVAGSVSAPRQALGLERFWQYDSTPTGAGSAAHANLATGNLVWHKMPVVNRGRGLSSVVNVTYNSHDTTGLLENLPLNLRYQEMGRGFSLAVSGLSRLNEPLAGVSLAGIPTVPNQIGLSDADGTRHTFNRIGGTTQYSHPPGVNLRLRRFTAPPLIVLPGANTSKTWAITRPDGTTFYYDANGYERSIVDRNGNTITFEYETYLPLTGTVVGACPLLVLMDGIVCAQRVRRVIDPAGRAIEISYRPGTKRAGMIDRIVDHRFLTPGTRRATRFIYDDDGYLKEIAEALTEGLQATPETRITKFDYTTDAGSSDQQLRRIVDPLGHVTDIEYAAPNPPTQLLAGGGPPVRSITDRREKKTSYEFGFFPDATRTKVVDALERPTRYALDASGRPTEKVDARETSTTLTWDGNHNVEQLTLAAGTPEEAVTRMTHNPNGMLLTRTDPESTEANPKVLTLTYRDGAGTQTTAADANGIFVSDLTSITSPEGDTTTFGLDERGNTTSRTDGEDETAHTTFDAFGQIQTETDEVGNVTRYEQYDPNGLPQQVVSPRGVAADPDASGGRWIYRYDGVGNVVSVTDPRAGEQATVADPGAAFTTTIAYDALDRPTKTSSPKDSPSVDDEPGPPDPTQLVHDTVYDLNDNVIARIDAERNETTATFTPTDQLQTVSTPGVPHGASGTVSAETTRYAHDDVDNVIRMVTPRGESTTTVGDFETEYRYSPVDERVAEIRHSTSPADPATLATSWAYDRRGNTIGIVDPRQNARFQSAVPEDNALAPSRRRVTYEYDKSDNRRAQIEDPGGERLRSEWRYDRNDRMIERVDPRGFEAGNSPDDFVWRYGYDGRDLLTSVESPPVGHTGEENAARRRTEYERRADGKLIGVTTPRGTQTSDDPDDFKTELDYDADGALRSRTMPRAPGQYGPPSKVTWERDAVGNPIAVRDARRHRFTNTFYDSGALKSTTRPSWWTYDEDAMTVRERTLEEIMQANSAGDEPREQSAVAQTDFGGVEAEAMPDWMPKSGKTTFGYDAEMRLTRVTDVADKASTIVRDALGRVQTTARPFDQDGELPVLPETITAAVTYDFNGNVLSERDGESKVTRYNYDQFDRRIRQVAPGSSTAQEITNYTLDRNGNVTDVVTPRGTAYESGFDRLDRLTSSTNPVGDETTFAYDAAANKVAQTQPRGNVSGVSAAQRARHTTTWTYNRAGDMSSHRTGLGDMTTFGYDRNANQVRVTAPGAASSAESASVVRAHVTTRTFDGRDLPWATTVGTGTDARTTVIEFDGNGNPRRQVNPRGVGSNGRPTADDDHAPDTEPAKDFLALTDNTDATRHATVREFSSDDLLESIHMPWGDGDGANSSEERKRFRMNFELDARGRVSTIDAPYEWSQDHAKAQRTKYGHFDNGWVQSVSDERIVNPTVASDPEVFVPDHVHDYEYDRRGLQTDWTSNKNLDTVPAGERGRRIHRQFYDNGLLRSRSARRNDQDTTPRFYTYEYSPNGSLTTLNDVARSRETEVTYDNADRAVGIKEEWAEDRDTAYAYDPDGNVTTRRVDGRIPSEGGGFEGGRTTRFTFDELGREESMRVVVPGGTDRVTSTSYWPSGQVRERDKALGATDETFFDTAGRMSQMVRRSQGGGTVKDQAYAYDGNANRRRDERGEHVFNARDQLVQWTRAAGRPGAGSVVEYELNASGAVRLRTDGSLPVGQRETEFVYVEEPEPGAMFIGDRLISSVQGGQTTRYEYNALGNITRIDVPVGADTTYDYDDFERRRATTGPGGAETYTYDALDRRDTTTRGGQTFAHGYVGLTEKLSREQATTAVRSFDYDSLLSRQGQTTGAGVGAYRSYAVDAGGSVEGLESATGVLASADTYVYDPYGELEGTALSPAATSAPF
ncbi:MAG: Ig-like domain-containing protein, partial [Solirubrobacteraceae bacterium]|nr:Ig-like domain-containing protein [Solirubrobacteraceae bacterium]